MVLLSKGPLTPQGCFARPELELLLSHRWLHCFAMGPWFKTDDRHDPLVLCGIWVRTRHIPIADIADIVITSGKGDFLQ